LTPPINLIDTGHKTQALLDQLLGVEMSRGAIAKVRKRLSAVLAEPMAQVLEAARQQPVAYVDETGAPTGSADGNNPSGKRGWQWVMVTNAVTVFIQGLSRSTAAAIELLGNQGLLEVCPSSLGARRSASVWCAGHAHFSWLHRLRTQPMKRI